MIDILSVDQWTSTGDIEKLDFNEVTLNGIKGGDSEAAKVIFGGSLLRLTVHQDARPQVGDVWFIKGPDGKCQFYKANYDSSG